VLILRLRVCGCARAKRVYEVGVEVVGKVRGANKANDVPYQFWQSTLSLKQSCQKLPPQLMSCLEISIYLPDSIVSFRTNAPKLDDNYNMSSIV